MVRRLLVLAILMATSARAGDAPAIVKKMSSALSGLFGYVQFPTPSGTNVFFLAGSYDPYQFWDLWVSDGVTAHPVTSLPGFTGDFHEMVAFQGGAALLLTVYGGANQLWFSDGTSAGTSIVSLVSNPRKLTVAHPTVGPDVLYFLADGAQGHSLWRTDGTQAGTVSVTGIASCSNDELIAWGPQVFFSGPPSGGTGCALWQAGPLGPAAAVHDVPSAISAPTVAGSLLFFTAGGLWKSDGLAADTVQLAGTSGAQIVGTDGTLLYFSLPGAPFQLAKTDGTPAGTRLVKDGLPIIGAGVGVAGHFVFASGGHPWTTDGTAAGTVQLNAATDARPLGVNGGKIFFSASDAALRSLYTTDGTPGGTVKLGGVGSDPGTFAPRGTGAVYSSVQYTTGQALMVTDGTAGGTRMLVVPGGGNPAKVEILAPVGADLYFTAIGDGATVPSLWRTNGTAAGTLEIQPMTGSDVIYAVSAVGSAFYYSVRGALWRSDGSTAAPVIDLKPKTIDNIVAAGNTAILLVRGTSSALELWKSDGTAAGTVSLSPVASGNPDTVVGEWNGSVYFPVDDGGGAFSLWKTDGTTAGTTRVKSISTSGAYRPPKRFTAAGALLYFLGDDGTHQLGLWKTDGTAAGTAFVADLTGGTGWEQFEWSSKRQATAVGSTLYLTAPAGLFKSDGTAAGTVKINGQNNASGLRALGSGVAFVADLATRDRQLWFSDGTPGPAVQLTDLHPRSHYGLPGSSALPLSTGSRLFFSGRSDSSGAELWSSDGTVGGTRLQAELASGPEGSTPTQLTQAGAFLYFVASDGVQGRQLYQLRLDAAGGTGPGATTGGGHGCSSSAGGSLWALLLAIAGIKLRKARHSA